MRRRPNQPVPEQSPTPSGADAGAIMQVKVWLVGISPMVWRRVLVPATFTLGEPHGVIQVVMGWEGIHLYQFRLRAARYGSWELSAHSPNVTLAALRFREGARFVYEYDLNIPWHHEVRIEDQLEPEIRKIYPICTGGDDACPRASAALPTQDARTKWSRPDQDRRPPARRHSNGPTRRGGGDLPLHIDALGASYRLPALA